METIEESCVCTICLNQQNNKTIEIKCGHKFHKNCLKQWVINQNNIILGRPDDDLAVTGTCPLCRQSFKKVFLSDKYEDNFKVKTSYYPLIAVRTILKIFKFI